MANAAYGYMMESSRGGMHESFPPIGKAQGAHEGSQSSAPDKEEMNLRTMTDFKEPIERPKYMPGGMN